MLSCGRPRAPQDGRNWARIEAEHHSHALFDRGALGDWDAAYIAAPHVLLAGPRDLRLFYHSYDETAGKFRVGLATSEDGLRCAHMHHTVGVFDCSHHLLLFIFLS
jgi:hypothetical protein